MIKQLKDLYAQHLVFEESNEWTSAIKSYLVESRGVLTEGKYGVFLEKLTQLAEQELSQSKTFEKHMQQVETKKELLTLLFPENKIEINDQSIAQVRESREVTLTKATKVIGNPLSEILFTSNIMLTMPTHPEHLSDKYAQRIDRNEKQSYWFDHPIPLDIEDKSNEILYGLTHFNESVSKELQEGEKVTIVLSVSCTHHCLKNIAKEYIEEKLNQVNLEYLEIYLFTENETEALIDYCYETEDVAAKENLKATFGVDGKYGRHYSFLKGIAAFFAKHVDSRIKATYKIDLDQVFDQERIKAYTGSFAFEKLKNTRWGAEGIDAKGKKVKLGMMAGYLINDTDIHKSMYEADVMKPSETLTNEQYVFNSGRPQYVSTVAEMLNPSVEEGKASMRYHITGGMNGVLVEDLITYTPFTPSFIARAEDQAFMLSIISKPVNDVYLRCYHQHGFFMRHDKGTFLEEDLKRFEIAKKVGDYERILLFTHYAKDILGQFDTIKEEIQPFTSSFITEHPYTVTLFRVLFGGYEIAKKSTADAQEFFGLIADRLSAILQLIDQGVYQETYDKEKAAWECYYDLMKQDGTQNIQAKAFAEQIRYKG